MDHCTNTKVKNMSDIKFSEETLAVAHKLIVSYPEGKQKSALIPLLHLAQAEFDGWLSPEVMDYVASLLNIQSIEAYEVASFYSMFNLNPVGKCLIEVCRTSSCWLRGANEIIEHIEKKFGIKEGETTPDGMFTLKTVECLGSCGTAPMMMVGAQFHENLTFEKVDNILENCQGENKRKTYLDKVVINHY
jgi:NADH-quinone oxidoreductase subunit E